MTRTLHLAEQLIALPSITPLDEGCLNCSRSAFNPWDLCANGWTAGLPIFASAIYGQKGLQRILDKRWQLSKP